MKEMSLTEHLEDLRKTLIRVVVILVGGFFICYAFGAQISEFLLTPLRHALIEKGVGSEMVQKDKIVYLGILDKVVSQLQVAFWSAIVLSSPLWFREIWKFIKPGLYDHEIKSVRPFLGVGFVLFMAGVLFGYYLVFPITFDTLLNFGVKGVEASIGLKEYLVLSSKVLVLLGLIFQLPNLLLILGFMGVVTKYSLRSMRRYVYVILALCSAMITPPDVITMVGLWFPLVALFEIGVLAVAFIVHPYLEKQHT